jgi:hypothetical protein
MSAWVVSKNHIDLLVSAMFKYELVTPEMEDANSIGKTLWEENRRSVNFRYSERKKTPPYTYSGIEVQELVREPWIVFKQICCYQYQSSECNDWEKTKAYILTSSLYDHVLRYGLHLTASDAYNHPNWEAAPWGIN